MATDFKTWTKGLFSVIGSALAGPTGALIGSLAGGLSAAIVPGDSDFFGIVSIRLAADTLESACQRLLAKLDPIERKRINHDLQTAFRDAFREAIYDMGGERCFPQVWHERLRAVPSDIQYLASPEGDKLWQEQKPLAEQIRLFFKEMLNAIAEQRLLPFAPPLDQPADRVYNYLEAETPQALNEVFFNTILLPFFHGFGTLHRDLPDFETYLQRYLPDRVLIHLGEMLKTRGPTWCAYNRLMLEELCNQIRQIDAGQVEILQRLEALLDHPEAQEPVSGPEPVGGSLVQWSDGLADLLSATGGLEKQVSESFEAVLGRLSEQQNEALLRCNLLLSAIGHTKEKIDRDLRIAEDRLNVIEGTPPVPVDEPPAPGEPPFKGLLYFTESDAGLFFGREQITARLVGRLHLKPGAFWLRPGVFWPASPGRKGTAGKGNFLAVIGASGSGKSSIIRAGLIPALQSDQPLANGDLPPTGSERWPVHILTPTDQPLSALAASLTCHSASTEDIPTLIEDLRRDSRSLGMYVLKLLDGYKEHSSDAEDNGVHRTPDRQKTPGLKGKRARPDNLLLVVDQFEELFTLCHDETERQAFIDNLLTAVDISHVILVITLRADFYAPCARYESLRQAIAACQEYIGPMSAAEMRRAIEEPARLNGWELEHGLVSVILHDLGTEEEPGNKSLPSEPDTLPLLSHALFETWKHRRGRMMTLESYTESGGVRGAIAETADRVFFRSLDLNQQVIAHDIFLRLTEPGQDAPVSPFWGRPPESPFLGRPPDTCRRALLSDLKSSPEAAAAAQSVLQTLAEARLITIDQESTELAHEAVIREWPALRKWLDEDREELRLHRQITEAAQGWRQLNNDTAAVYRGVQLAQAIEWAETYANQLSPLEREFIEFSKFVAERNGLSREAQRQQELEAAHQLAEEAETRRKAEVARTELAEQGTRRLRLSNRIITGISVLVVLAAFLAWMFAGYSRQQKSIADRNSETARQSQSTAQAASTQAVAQQITAEAQSHTRATAEADAIAQKATAVADAITQKATAEAARVAAQQQSRVSLSRELAAQSSGLTSRDADLALLLAVEAVGIAGELGVPPVAEAQTSLFHALQNANFSGVLRGHTGEVWSAVYSPDGKKILTTSQDGSARLWDLASGQAITVVVYTGGITSAVFNRDGTLILTTGQDLGQDGLSQDGVAQLWKLDSGPMTGSGSMTSSRIATLAGHTGIVSWGSFSPNGSLIVTAGQDKTARLWTTDGSELATLAGHTDWVTAAGFSPDGQRIITLSTDATARLWDNTGAPVATLIGHTQPVLLASFSPDSSRIITASADGTARIWLADGTPVTALEGHTRQVSSAFFSPDGQMIVTASFDNTARVWRSDGSLLAVLRGHSNSLNMAIFNADGTQILTASMDHTARLWHSDGSLISTLIGHTNTVYTARFSTDGNQTITASADNTVRVWDLDQLYTPTLANTGIPVIWAGFSPDGKLVLIARQDNVAQLYRLDGTLVGTLAGHTNGLTNASFSLDGAMIATASRDGTARIWSREGLFLTELMGHTGPVRSANFSPDGKLVVTAGEDGTARVYRVSGSLVLVLEGHAGVVWSAFFSPDGNRLVTASQDGTARIWDINGKLLHTINNHEVPVNMAAFSPDGQMVITAGQDGIARLWLADGTPVVGLVGHTQMVNWAAFSPDGELIATASNDGTARLWTIDGKFLASVEGHTYRVTSVGFSPDGTQLVTASWDGTARLWSVFGNLETMRAKAIQRVGRWLTEAECQRYLHQATAVNSTACPLIP